MLLCCSFILGLFMQIAKYDGFLRKENIIGISLLALITFLLHIRQERSW